MRRAAHNLSPEGAATAPNRAATVRERSTMKLLTRRNWIALAGTGIASWSRAHGFGKEFWDTKEPDAWSADEIAKLLMKSPWAKTISGERTRRPVGMGAPRSRIPGT